MPTAASVTYTNYKLEAVLSNPAPAHDELAFAPSQTIVAGTWLAQTTSTGKLATYNVAGSDGLNVAKYLAMYTITVNSDGTIAYGTGVTAGEFGQVYLTAPAYLNGGFNSAECTYVLNDGIGGLTPTLGVTQPILNDLQGRMVSGVVATSGTSGVVQF